MITCKTEEINYISFYKQEIPREPLKHSSKLGDFKAPLFLSTEIPCFYLWYGSNPWQAPNPHITHCILPLNQSSGLISIFWRSKGGERESNPTCRLSLRNLNQSPENQSISAFLRNLKNATLPIMETNNWTSPTSLNEAANILNYLTLLG